MTPPTHVTDHNGRRYALTQKLGEGAQGQVYATEGGRYAVKLVTAKRASRDQLRKQIIFVQTLALQQLAIARPIGVLREPDLGYVMEFVQDKGSLASALLPARGETNPLAFYRRSGGLRRRLRLLARLADLLARIHARGLAYGDLSPHNIFVPHGPAKTEPTLIDADNLQYTSRADRVIYTPRYGAPELLLGRSGVTTQTDAHAFAILAFEVLTLTHPLIGDLVLAGDPDLEDRALRGELPWIDHPTDESNRTTTGLPRRYALTQHLELLFQQAFTVGLTDASERPTIAEWAEALHAAANMAYACPTCGDTHYPFQEWCAHEVPPLLTVTSCVLSPEISDLKLDLASLSSLPGYTVWVIALGDDLVLHRSAAYGVNAPLDDDPELLRVRFLMYKGQMGMVLDNLGEAALTLTHPERPGPIELPPQTHRGSPVRQGAGKLTVHLGRTDGVHRTLQFHTHLGGTA